MDDHAGGLLENEDVGVLEENGQRRRFRDELLGGWGRNLHLDTLASCEPRRGLPDRAVDANAAGLDERLEPRARELGQLPGEPAVESRARRGRIDGEADEPRRGGRFPHGEGAGERSPRRRRTRSATPTVIAESATLNAGQCQPR